MCFLFWTYILYANRIINTQPQAKLHEMALGIIAKLLLHTEPLPNNYWSRFILSVMAERTQKLAFSMKTLLLLSPLVSGDSPGLYSREAGMGCCLATACSALFYQPREMLSLDLMPFSTMVL